MSGYSSAVSEERNGGSPALALAPEPAPEWSGGTGRSGAAAPPRRRWRRPLLRIPLAALTGGRGFAWDRAEVGEARELERPIREGLRAEVALRDAVFRRSLALADVLAAVASVLLSVTVVGHRALELPALLALPLVLIAAKLIGAYDRDELLVNKATLEEAPRLLQLATLYTLLFSLLQSEFVRGRLGALDLLALWGSMFAFTFISRHLARACARAMTPTERCLFVGSEHSAERLRAKLSASGGHVELVGRMSIDGATPSSHLTEATAEMHRLLSELRIHRVVIEPSEPQPQVTLDFVREAKSTGARVSLLPRILEVVGSSIEVDDVDGLTLLGVRQFGLSRSSRLIKRVFDTAGAIAGLLLLSPLLAVIAVVIRFTSAGPVIYKQTRIGREGRPFLMWKFRTMIDGADRLKPSLRGLNEADGLFKIADDPRITGVGSWLRRYSLDELPQLVNVIRGEMSLVGPRPLVRDDDEQITGLDRRRLDLTPGMTGSWQILGSARVPLAEMIKLDYLYVTGWSLWADVKILLRTVPYVLRKRGM